MDKKLSIIIALADNEHPHTLNQAVEALAAQSIPSNQFEVIVINTYLSGEDEQALIHVVESAKQRVAIHCFCLRNASRAEANNFGISKAANEILVFLADDFVPCKGFAAAHLNFHQQHPDDYYMGVGPCFFPKALRENQFMRWLEDSGTLIGISFTKQNPQLPRVFFYTGNSSIKKAFIIKAGLFDECFLYPAWDDYELSLRLSKLNAKSVFISEAKASHIHWLSIAGRKKSMRQAGEAAVLVEHKHKAPYSWRKQTKIPVFIYHAYALFQKLLYVITKKQQCQARYYQATLTATFVASYKRHYRKAV